MDAAFFSETLALETSGQDEGYQIAKDGALTAWRRTPGYETYRGLGWYGVIQEGGLLTPNAPGIVGAAAKPALLGTNDKAPCTISLVLRVTFTVDDDEQERPGSIRRTLRVESPQ